MSTAALLPDRPATPTLTAHGWSFPAVTQTTLTNGTQVLSVDLPGRELIAVRMLLAAPLTTEPRDGLFAMLSGLWTEGSTELSGLEFATAIEMLGADLGGAASYTGLQVRLDVSARHLAPALALATAALADPGYTEQSLERALRNHEASFEQLLDDPSRRTAMESARLALAAGSRASRPSAGTPADLQDLTVERLLDAHRQHVRADLATVVVAGDLRGTDPAALVESAFAGWTASAGTTAPAMAADLEPGPDPAARWAVERPDAVQTNLRLARCLTGFSLRQWTALDIAMSILAGGPTSRLTTSLREERGLTYGVYGQAQRWTATTGTITVSTAVEATATGEAVAETERIIAAALADGFTADEVAQAVRYRLGSEPIGMQSAAGVADTLVGVISIGEGPAQIDDARRMLSGLEPAEVLDALRAALPDGQLTLTSVGPTAAWTELTLPMPDVGPAIRQALAIVTRREAAQAADENDHADGETDEEPDGAADEETARTVEALVEQLSTAEPGSPRQGALALALFWLPSDLEVTDDDVLLPMVTQALPADHPHWSLWVKAFTVGPQVFMSMDADPASRAYIAEVAQRHPDPDVRLPAACTLEVSEILQRTMGRPEEERSAELEAAIGHLYRDRPDQLDTLLRWRYELLFDPDGFLREFPAGSPAPDFSLRLIDGRPVTLADFAGSPVLIYFTGTWCSPCQIETPAIVALHKKWHPRGVRFLGVAMEESDEGFTDYLAAKGITWDFAVVAESDPIIETFLVQAFPTLVVLGPQNTVLGAGIRASEEPEVIEELFEQGLDAAAGADPTPSVATPSEAAVAATAAAGPAPVTAVVTAQVAGIEPLADGVQRVRLAVDVQTPWKVYPPGCAEGIPLDLRPGPGSDTQLLDWSLVDAAGQTLSGEFGIEATLRPGSQGWQLELRTQACSGDRCQTPRRLTVGRSA